MIRLIEEKKKVSPCVKHFLFTYLMLLISITTISVILYKHQLLINNLNEEKKTIPIETTTITTSATLPTIKPTECSFPDLTYLYRSIYLFHNKNFEFFYKYLIDQIFLALRSSEDYNVEKTKDILNLTFFILTTFSEKKDFTKEFSYIGVMVNKMLLFKRTTSNIDPGVLEIMNKIINLFLEENDLKKLSY